MLELKGNLFYCNACDALNLTEVTILDIYHCRSRLIYKIFLKIISTKIPETVLALMLKEYLDTMVLILCELKHAHSKGFLFFKYFDGPGSLFVNH